MNKAVGIIPARWASSRFPGKPLHLIAGKPLLQRVWERCLRARKLDAVIIATDDMRIANAAFDWGAEVALTSTKHQSGTDRIAEVAKKAKTVCIHCEHSGRRTADRSALDRPDWSISSVPNRQDRNRHRGASLCESSGRPFAASGQSRRRSSRQRALFLPFADPMFNDGCLPLYLLCGIKAFTVFARRASAICEMETDAAGAGRIARAIARVGKWGKCSCAHHKTWFARR